MAAEGPCSRGSNLAWVVSEGEYAPVPEQSPKLSKMARTQTRQVSEPRRYSSSVGGLSNPVCGGFVRLARRVRDLYPGNPNMNLWHCHSRYPAQHRNQRGHLALALILIFENAPVIMSLTVSRYLERSQRGTMWTWRQR